MEDIIEIVNDSIKVENMDWLTFEKIEEKRKLLKIF
jgi:hypothetical protein